MVVRSCCKKVAGSCQMVGAVPAGGLGSWARAAGAGPPTRLHDGLGRWLSFGCGKPFMQSAGGALGLPLTCAASWCRHRRLGKSTGAHWCI